MWDDVLPRLFSFCHFASDRLQPRHMEENTSEMWSCEVLVDQRRKSRTVTRQGVRCSCLGVHTSAELVSCFIKDQDGRRVVLFLFPLLQ